MRNSNQITFFSIIFSLLSLLYIIVKTEEFFLLVIFIIFALLGILFYKKKEERMFFYLSLAISIFFAIPLTYSYIQFNDLPFIPGGDARDYYDKVVRMVQGDFSMYFGRYKLFLYTFNLFYRFVNLFVSTTHYTYFVFLNIFFGANISPILYKIGSQFFDKKIVLNACFLTLLFPSLIQVAAGTWREAMVYMFFIYSIYLSLNLKPKNIILYILSFFIIANVRMEAAVISFIFLICYNLIFSSRNNKVKRKSPYLYLFFAIIIFIVLYNYGLFSYLNSESSSLSYQQDAYDSRHSIYWADDSITANLRKWGVLGRVLLFFYSIFMPIPPPWFTVKPVVFFNIFISIGHILWYFILPSAIISIIKTFKNKILSTFSKSFLISFISCIALIALTTVGTERHKLYLYPIIFLYFFYYNATTPVKIKRNLYVILLMVYSIAVLGYVLLKYL